MLCYASSAIAEELIAWGIEVIFIGGISDVPWLASRINCLGFSQILHKPEAIISDPSRDVLILDSHAIFVDDEFIQSNKWRQIVTI